MKAAKMKGLISSSSSSTSTVGSGSGKVFDTNSNSPISKSKSGGGFLMRFCGKYLKIGKHPTIQSPLVVVEQPWKQYNSNSRGKSSPSSSDHLEQVFSYFDEDGDGKISASELQNCLRAVGSCDLSDEDAEKAVRSSDADGDGMLGFHDFAKIMENADDDDKIQELREAFAIYSDDDDIEEGGGERYISPKSLKKMLTQLGQSTNISSCKVMISKFDFNGDGLLNFEEFRMMML